MINLTGVELRPSGSLGIVSASVLSNVQPGVSSVNSLFRLVQGGIFPQLNLINTALFKSTDLPNIPSHLSASFTYDAGKKICLRQHASFWSPATYTTNSLGDGVTPWTPYNLFMSSVSMPQMHQQNRVMLAFKHTAAPLANSAASGFTVPRIGRDQISATTTIINYAKFVITGSSTAGVIGRGNISAELISAFDRVTPEASNQNSFSISAAGSARLTYGDVLKDEIIAASRNIYGYGNTSNGGLNSYKYYSYPLRNSIAEPYMTWHDEPTGAILTDTIEQANYRNFDEEVTTDITCIKPCKLILSESYPANLPVAPPQTFLDYVPHAGDSIDWIHRIESLRIYGLSSNRDNLAEPDSPTPV